jgi:hypothetical protein
MAVKSDITRKAGESIGGVALRYDHVDERNSEGITTSYHDSGAEDREGISNIAKGDEGAPAVWSGSNGMTRKSSRVIAVGAGKAVRVTKYGYPRWGGIDRDRGTMDTSLGSRSVPWLLFDPEGSPVFSGGAVMGADRDDIGSYRGTILIKETLTTFKFNTRETGANSPWGLYNGQIDRLNRDRVAFNVGEVVINCSPLSLRFDGVAMSARKENFNTVFYNTYFYTHSPLRWGEQYIPPYAAGGEEPDAYAADPKSVKGRREYKALDTFRVPPGF